MWGILLLVYWKIMETAEYNMSDMRKKYLLGTKVKKPDKYGALIFKMYILKDSLK